MDEINTQGGAAVQGDVDTRDFIGRDTQRMIGDVNFLNKDSERIWQALMDTNTKIAALQERLGDKIALVDFKLDDLPRRVGVLEVKVEPVPVPVPVMVPILLSVWISIGFGLFIALLLVGAYFIIV